MIRDNGNLSVRDDFPVSFPQIESCIKQKLKQSFLLTIGGDRAIGPSVKVQGIQSDSFLSTLIPTFRINSRVHPILNACPLRRAMEYEQFSAQKTVLVGTRCFEAAGLRYIEAHHLRCFPAYEVENRGMKAIAADIIKQFSDLTNVYLLIDLGTLDRAFAPGTGMPDAGVLSTRVLLTLITLLDPLPIVGADIVEVSPPLDSADITSVAALRLITALFGVVHRRKLRKAHFKLLEGL